MLSNTNLQNYLILNKFLLYAKRLDDYANALGGIATLATDIEFFVFLNTEKSHQEFDFQIVCL
jgi:hypothetical protein